MEPKFYLASFIACFLYLNCFAQKKQNVYFLKNNGKYVTERDSADYTRIVQEPDSGSVLYNVLEYYPNGNPKMVGKSSAVDPIKLEGQNISFYPNKNKKRVCIYKNGRPFGATYDYYPNGKMYRTMEYLPDDQKLDVKHPTIELGAVVHSVYDSAGTEIVKDGNGHYQVYSADYKNVEEEGDLKDGKRNGTWKGTSNKGKLTFTEEYADGKFVKGTSIDAAGNTNSYMVKEALPTFRGGESGFGNYLSKSILYPSDAKRNNIQGRVIVSFVVETSGQLTDFKILRDIGGGCGQEAVRVLEQSPKWNPGLQHGTPVRVAYTMPINFTLGGR